MLDDLERNYQTGWERRKVLKARIMERRGAAAQGVDVDAVAERLERAA